MGRRTESAEHHWLRGTKPRPNQRNESDRESDTATVNAGRPRPPKDLTELELAHWKAAAKVMKSRGTLSKGDGEALELWSRTKARYSVASKALADEGLIITETRYSKSGNEYTVQIPNPHLKIVEQCERALQQMAAKLGLNPMDRSKVKPTKGHRAGAAKFVPKEGTAAALMPQLFTSGGKLRQVV
jgi:P27 family predicted phage terminase small subunit